MKKFNLLLLALVVSFAFFSCGKKRQQSQDGLQSAEDNKLAQDNFTYIYDAIDTEAQQDDGDWSGKNGKTYADTLAGQDSCIILTYDSVSQEKALHFGYDAASGAYANCSCKDGKIRRGKLVLTFSGKYFDTGTIVTITADGFYAEDHLVEGTMALTFLANNANGNPERQLLVTNGKITAPDGSWHINFTRDQTIEMIAGANTIFWPFDNIFKITETGSGVNQKGFTYTYDTSTPIIVRWNCIFAVVDGVLEIKTDDLVLAELDMDPIGEYDATGVSQPCDLAFKVTTIDGKEHKFFY